MSHLDSLNYAVKSAVKAAADIYEPFVQKLMDSHRELASKNRSLKDEVKELRTKLADTSATTSTATTSTTKATTKSAFKGSHELQTAMAKARALQSSLDHAFAEEQKAWEQAQLVSITSRTKKLLEESAYKNALKSDFATAQTAINRKKQEVQANGIPGYVGISGEYVTGLFDKEDQTFLTFEQLFASSVEINGSEYHVIKADLSSIDAGHVYHLTLAKKGHANA